MDVSWKPRSPTLLALVAGTVVLLAIGLGGARSRRGRAQPAAVPASAPYRVGILPFASDAPSRQPMARALAESLSTRLRQLPGLAPHHTSLAEVADDQLVIGGDVAATQSSRLLISLRLLGRSARDTLWTGTAWSGDSLSSELVSEVAELVGEALYGRLARGRGSNPPEEDQ